MCQCPDLGKSVRGGRYDGARTKLGDERPIFIPYLRCDLVKNSPLTFSMLLHLKCREDVFFVWVR